MNDPDALMNENTPQTRRRTILLVDDNERVLQFLTKLLQWSGEWEVVGMTTQPSEALQQAATHQPDLVLLDLWMPHMNGLDLLPHLLALSPPPRIVVITADQSESIREQAMVLGASAYLDKLMPPDDLLAELRKV